MSLSSILNGNIVATPIKITPEQINVVFKSSSQPTLVKLKPSATLLQEILFKKEKQGTDDDSSLILSFLRSSDLQLTSESGAEYSYYNVSVNLLALALKTFLTKVGLGFLLPPSSREFHSSLLSSSSPLLGYKAEVISPASERQIQRAMPSSRMFMVTETPQLYESAVQPHITSILSNERSLSWLWNILDKKKEVERLLLDEEGYIMNVDTKWGSHTPMFSDNVPKEMWKLEKAMIVDLYCLAIVQERGIATLRDLRSRHVPVLHSIATKGRQVIEDVYGVPPEELRVFIHYHPQFYHLHIHFTRLWNDGGCQVERAHLLDEVILNLEGDDEYYKNKTMFYKLNESEKLAKAIVSTSTT